MVTCPHCDYTGNPAYATTCMQCRLDLPLSNPQPVSTLPQYKQKQKMAVFDLDKTLFDLTRRERVAKRAGHNLDTPAAWAEMNKPQHISKDEPIAGTVQFVNDLAKDGYVIAYLSGRPNNLMGPTREHLQRSGYPVHKGTDSDLIFLAPVPGRYDPNIHFQRIVSYKKDILTRLSSQYDLTFYFDDSQEFRNAAMSIRPRIPAVYASVADYTGNRAYAPRAGRVEKPAAANPGSPQEDQVELDEIPVLSKSQSRRMSTVGSKALKEMGITAKDRMPDIPGDSSSLQLAAAIEEVVSTNPTTFYNPDPVELKDMVQHNFVTHDYEKTPPFGYPISMLKKLRSFLHEGREYIGFVQINTIFVGTGHDVASCYLGESAHKYLWENRDEITLTFHTHPTRKWGSNKNPMNTMNPPSLADYVATMIDYFRYGQAAEVVVTKNGFHFLRPYVKPRSAFAKLLAKKKWTKADGKKAVELLKADMMALRKGSKDIYQGIAELFFGELQLFDEGSWGEGFCALVNKKLKTFQFHHHFLDIPLSGVSWKKPKKGSNMLEGSYKTIRSNPSDPACPLATQDLEVNTKNRDAAIAAEHIKYGPLNLNDEAYWARYAEKWGTTPEVAKKSNCSNCVAFDISPRMKDCMPGKTSDDEGELGYCWMHHFKCHSARTCNTWAAGGPIDLDKVSLEWQERSSQVKSNPVSRPRKKRASDGNMKREPAKQYFNRLMSELHKEFPDNSQRAAVALSYVEKEYGQRGVNSVTKTWAKNNPGEGEKVNLLPIYSGTPTQTYKSLGMVTSVVQVGRNVIKDIKEGIQDIYRGLVGGRQSLTEKRMMMSVLLMHSDLSEATLALGGNAICNLKIDYEIPSYQGSSRMDITLIATADAIKMGRGTVKSNPGGTTVEEAKKMYKQFHQTEPNSVTKKKVDFGDTWVGLGKAWSIGYRSPKETGSKEQKYIHHFGKDEDTGKTYKEPELYYVENKDGTKMMVIMGGDWYIDVDSDGEVSWIYI